MVDDKLGSKEICVKYFKDYKCEVCGNEPAMSFSFSVDGCVKLAGMCTSDTEYYYVEFHRFFGSPSETVDWFAHLADKKWFRKSEFCEALERLAPDGCRRQEARRTRGKLG